MALLAIAGAIASWIVGAVSFARTRGAAAGGAFAWVAVVAWPLFSARLPNVPPERAAEMNKALVAFIACILVAAAAWSAASNLLRISK
ncbi:MAG TPA: hypothetical protein VHA77_11175 [Xanthobacteraceae bacterium]|nr:hypothetical protein [Xanthobacteraceae bacterium]